MIRLMFFWRKLTVPAASLMVIHQLCEALIPFLAGRTVDEAIATGNQSSLWWWIGALVLCFAVLDVAARFGGRLGSIATQTAEHGLRMELTDRIIDRRGFADDSRPPGALLSIATTDAKRAAMVIMVGLRPVAEVAALIFASIILLTVSVPVGIAVLVGGFLLTWGAMAAGGPLRRRVGARQQAAAEAAATASDLVSGFRTLAGLGSRRAGIRRYRRRSRHALNTTVDAIDAESILVGTVEVLGGIFVALVAAGSGVAAVHGHLTVGELITVVGLAQFIIDPMTALGKNAAAVWADAAGSTQRVLALLREPVAVSDVDGEKQLESSALEFDGVSVPAGAHRVISADAATMARWVSLLTVAEQPERGQYFIGGVDAADLLLSETLSHVLVAPHSADLFDGTIADNLRMVAPDATDAELAAAMKAAACDDVIELLPEGMDTDIGDAGIRLSGGQRQRIAAARALLADAPILVLVDPTTAVDSVTEQRVATGVAEMRAGRTTVVFSSSPAWHAVMPEDGANPSANAKEGTDAQ